MARAIDWGAHIGRRLRLRDLHVLFQVVECGSMAKAAAQMRITQSAVSQAIADLEHTVGVRLLDRSPRGVEATIYGAALLRRGKAAFDELRQGILELDYLADASVGEIRLGCPETLTSAILPTIVTRFSAQHPGAMLEVDNVTGVTSAPRLRDRSLDLVFARGGPGLASFENDDDVRVETLFEDKLAIVVGSESPWARRRKVTLADLRDAPWISVPYGLTQQGLGHAFAAAGLGAPNIVLKTFSIHLRLNLIVTGRFVTTLPRSVINCYRERFAFKVLPIDLLTPGWTVAIATLRHRTLNPLVLKFIECARSVARR